MKWTRATAERSRYEAGPYVVESHGSHGWFVDGPGVESGHRPTKAEAQRVAVEAAAARITDETRYTVEPVVGDWAYCDGYCRITAVFTGGTGNPVYVLLTSRKKRRCLSRYEFPLVTR